MVDFRAECYGLVGLAHKVIEYSTASLRVCTNKISFYQL